MRLLFKIVVGLFFGVLLQGCGVDGARHSSHESSELAAQFLGSGGSAKWASPVTILAHEDLNEEAVAGLIAALTTWNDALNSNLLIYGGRSSVGRGDELYSSLEDTATVVYLETNWQATTGKDTFTLGTTVWEVDGENGSQITRGDIILNGETYDFFDSEDFSKEATREGGVVDAETVLLHEVGHLIGLGHIYEDVDADSIMGPYTEIGYGDHHRVLSIQDIERAKALYNIP